MFATIKNVENAVGETIPPLTAHAVSVSLPTWKSNVAYEEGEDWVIKNMKTGYPRFFIHLSIARLAEVIVEKHALPSEQAMLFPTHKAALRCLDFFNRQVSDLGPKEVRILDLVPAPENLSHVGSETASPSLSAVIFPKERFPTAKSFWQHSGEGISSRRAEYCYELFKRGLLVEKEKVDDLKRMCKGPRRYQKKVSMDSTGPLNGSNGHTSPEESKEQVQEGQDSLQFIEERFGRNLNVSLANKALHAVKRRIAGSLTADLELTEALEQEADNSRVRQCSGFSEDDVYIYSCGMNAIYNTHRSLLVARGPMKSIEYGFPYVDTLKILEKFGPGCLFYGMGESEELDDLERRLRNGERYLALFCEFPGNPLLKTPDLVRIKRLADEFDFAVVIDETIGNFINVNVLPYADVVVSSLTKIFSGDCNVMGGSAVLNPKGRYYNLLKQTWEAEFENNYWPEDTLFLERNSRDFVSRIERINLNAEAICEVLLSHPRIKQVNYPKHSPTKRFYDQCRTVSGGYGGLLSATFYRDSDAVAFYDNLDTAKGPSLGTNFTLSSPFVILAHYNELPWASSFGVDSNLVRFSVGLEETDALVAVFRRALAAIPQ
ncbi:PLP-dependent transferase [Aulographum hederae CBS 113979]|uniref:cystathionine gamma-synthase n=1 Tax=Aulographum hederae CBS 113979 TaxID=1176131 RepID=A0A6G1H5D8_9PEZI|nr:PLP-dependent transferase [Aulographum hederae CBS 113979]